VLQVLGTWLVHHFLHTDSAYGVFGSVLGLIAWIYVAAMITVFSAEINVVLARRLWPRTILQPPLTEADRASMALQALQNQRRPEQHVEVTFDDREPGSGDSDRTPRTPEEVAPPAHTEVPSPRGVPEPEAATDTADNGGTNAADGDPSTANGHPSTANGHPSTANGHPSTANGHPSTANGDAGTASNGSQVPKTSVGTRRSEAAS
jgi:hypothetical protein